MPAKTRPARQRNPRGQGERLRDDIIEAASRLLADPAAPPLTLRAVAREVGVAATSVYLHFDSIESLVLAVADRRFGELARLEIEAEGSISDPCERLRAGCLAYCEFGLAHPGHYQVMFTTPMPLPEFVSPEQMPGWKPFQQLINAVAACLGAAPDDPRALFTSHLIWQQMHGIVSLRISRPRFPHPPLAQTVTRAVDSLLAGARTRENSFLSRTGLGASRPAAQPGKPPDTPVRSRDVNPTDFASFYEQSRNDCLRAVLASVGDLDTAQDMVAEAFARAWASWRKVSRHPAPRAWVVRTALNASVSSWRRRRRELPLLGEPGSEDPASADDGPVDRTIMAALRGLPTRQRQVIALRIFMDLDTARTAEVLGIAPGTVRAHLSRAIDALRHDLILENE